ncbi:tetratricopeptide repeat-containing hybrid sensor histidine kinase/response regulator [Leeuwenhoekiella parthenopeia]|uniref:histidine kinase n=1 Tax=Leeuwenhoekiella parthenopeia TaxID=2890320 RepID=A0ABS8GXT7_9FLAO|nr:response regulator [Leeuwenhoekiella parthenopeia]MCC4214303.1 response regulator [Leeuwenhoekiella parthenopeia]
MNTIMLFDRNFVVALFVLFCLNGFGQKPKNLETAQEIQVESLLLKGIEAFNTAEFDKSIANFQEAKQLARKINNLSRVGISQQLLANVYLKQGEFDKAFPEIHEAIKIHQQLQESKRLGEDYLTYAQLLSKTNNNTEALKYLNESVSIFGGSGDKNDKQSLASAHLYKGAIFQDQKKDLLALEEFDEALQILSKLNDSRNNYSIARLKLLTARSRSTLNELESSLEDANTAYTMSVNGSFPLIETDALRLMSSVSKKMGKTEDALNYLELYTKRAQLYFQDDIASTRNLAARNALMADINPDNYDASKRVQANKITTVLIIALFTILCLLALSLYKNNNLRAKANELLQAKNAELVIAKENAEKASVVKAQFLSTITHELRTPMYAVTGLTHLLLSENPTEEQKKHLDSLKFSGEYLLSLINNILDLNKLEADKVEVEQATFNLRKRVDDVLFALERSAQEKGNKLHLEYDSEIPDQIIGDPLMISQILINLIGNGNKFTRDGDIFVRIKQLSRNNTQTYLHFEVEDTGEGISKKKQKDIFQNFTQGSVQINRKFGGTGLGLSIVKRLLTLQKSKIELESTLGKGSKFFFDIKYGLTQNKKEPEERVYEIDYDALKGRNILVVEDNKINQMITRKILEKNEMKCDVADNGEIAIEKVRFENYDLVLMDIHMPGISGIEATQKIREFNKDLPILALTAVTIDENIDDFYLAGFNDIIPKPYKVEEFFFKIHNALKRKNVIL